MNKTRVAAQVWAGIRAQIATLQGVLLKVGASHLTTTYDHDDNPGLTDIVVTGLNGGTITFPPGSHVGPMPSTINLHNAADGAQTCVECAFATTCDVNDAMEQVLDNLTDLVLNLPGPDPIDEITIWIPAEGEPTITTISIDEGESTWTPPTPTQDTPAKIAAWLDRKVDALKRRLDAEFGDWVENLVDDWNATWPGRDLTVRIKDGSVKVLGLIDGKPTDLTALEAGTLELEMPGLHPQIETLCDARNRLFVRSFAKVHLDENRATRALTPTGCRSSAEWQSPNP